MISNNIMKLYESNTTIMYRSACVCSDPNDDQHLILEYDNDLDTVSLIIYKTLTISSWKVIDRLIKAFTILFTGKLEYECDFLFRDENAIYDYIKALNTGIEKLKDNNN